MTRKNESPDEIVNDFREEKSVPEAWKKYSTFAHMFSIKSLPALLRDNDNDVFVCENCLEIYTSKEALSIHISNGCFEFHRGPEKVISDPIKFKHYNKLGKLPFFIVFDTEAFALKKLCSHQ